MKHALIALATLSAASMTASAAEPSVKAVRTAIHNNGNPCKATAGHLYIDGVALMRTDECDPAGQPHCSSESLKWTIINNCKEPFLVYVTNFRQVKQTDDCNKNPSGTVYPVCEGNPKKVVKGEDSADLGCKVQSTERGGKYCYDIGVRAPNGSVMVFDQDKALPMPAAKLSKFDVVYDPEIIIRRP